MLEVTATLQYMLISAPTVTDFYSVHHLPHYTNCNQYAYNSAPIVKCKEGKICSLLTSVALFLYYSAIKFTITKTLPILSYPYTFPPQDQILSINEFGFSNFKQLCILFYLSVSTTGLQLKFRINVFLKNRKI